MNAVPASIVKLIETAQIARLRKSYTHDRRPRVGYMGWLGHANLGDEVMIEAAQRLLPGVKLIHYDFHRREERLRRLKLSGSQYFSSCILGGGTLIHSSRYPELVETALKQKLPVWSLGTGVGNPGFDVQIAEIEQWKRFLDRFVGVGVRGPLSVAALEGIGFDQAKVIGDLAFSLCREILVPVANHKRVAFNLTLPKNQDQSEGIYNALPALETAIKSLLDHGYTVVPIAMSQQDIPSMQEFLSHIAPEPIVIHLPQTSEEFFDLVAPCSFTVAVRLHTAILSNCVGVPALMLGYREKCLDYMMSMGLEEWYIDLKTVFPSQIAERVAALSIESLELRETVLKRAQDWKRIQETYVQSVLDKL